MGLLVNPFKAPARVPTAEAVISLPGEPSNENETKVDDFGEKELNEQQLGGQPGLEQLRKQIQADDDYSGYDTIYDRME
jgi:hypothetical protein